ncbi:hypothetical protein AMR42_18165 [Limnothrix sp. PR1529]|nr:hypothetical protein BCR12_00190 [Limnothrix sp. P13C2]PIB03866.1 hypothetical protein AMR42_18165 [Limnothrix sp. PR1529]
MLGVQGFWSFNTGGRSGRCLWGIVESIVVGVCQRLFRIYCKSLSIKVEPESPGWAEVAGAIGSRS